MTVRCSTFVLKKVRRRSGRCVSVPKIRKRATRMQERPSMTVCGSDRHGLPETSAIDYGSVWNTLRAKKRFGMQSRCHRDDQDFNFNSVATLVKFVTTRRFSGRCIANAPNTSARSVTLSSTCSPFRHPMCVRHLTYWSTPIARRRSSSTSRPCLDCSLGKVTEVMACGTFPLTSSSRSSIGLSQHGAVRASQASRLLRPR